MARNDRKGAIVDRIKHPRTKREGAIRLDKQSMTFFARLPDEELNATNRNTRLYFESKDGNEVHRWLNGQLAKQEKAFVPTWLPVIEVEMERERHFYRHRDRESQKREVTLSAEIDRFYIALNLEQTKWLRLDWHLVDEGSSTALDETDRLVQAREWRDGPKAKPTGSWRDDTKPFKLPHADGSHHWVAFTPELWAGLNEVFGRLEDSRKTLEDLLATKKGLAALAEVGKGQLRLTAGTVTTEEVGNV